MLAAILRKLGLGSAAYRLISAFLPQSREGLSVPEALELLCKARPDSRRSCIAPAGSGGDRREAAGIELDIIVAVYNAEKYLCACLDSVLSQDTRFKFRLIAVDDGSTDGSAHILRRYESDSRVLVIHQENRGLSGARNAALELSTADYVYFLDADDMLCPGAIDGLMSAAAESHADIVEGSYVLTDNDGKPIRAFTHREGWLKSAEGCWGFACGVLLSASAMEGLRFNEGYMYEDSLMMQVVYPRTVLRGGGIFASSVPAFMYRRNPAGITQSVVSSGKCIDSLWVHMQLCRDRAALGIEKTQDHYEYMLRMLALTYRRTARQPEEIKRAVFAVFSDFLRKEFSEYKTAVGLNSYLEAAARSGDYARYKLFCSLCKI